MKVQSLCLPVLLLAFLSPSCRKEESLPQTQSQNLRFNPVVGESWTYEVTVRLAPGAQLPTGSEPAGPEGVVTKFTKIRRYVGEGVPTPDFEKAHTFEIYRDGELSEIEYSLFTPEGIFARGSKATGQSAFLLEPPVLLIPEDLAISSVWEVSLPNTNNPSGPPMVQRKFQYRGVGPIQVMGEGVQAHHVKVIGKTGPLQMQRDFWFVNSLGFVKERRSYYLDGKRVSLMEEVLTDHELPKG